MKFEHYNRIVMVYLYAYFMLISMCLLPKGKYVEIQFSRGGEPIGGRISNFLLEKVCNLRGPF